jgi:hypothetical protein
MQGLDKAHAQPAPDQWLAVRLVNLDHAMRVLERVEQSLL